METYYFKIGSAFAIYCHEPNKFAFFSVIMISMYFCIQNCCPMCQWKVNRGEKMNCSKPGLAVFQKKRSNKNITEVSGGVADPDNEFKMKTMTALTVEKEIEILTHT